MLCLFRVAVVTKYTVRRNWVLNVDQTLHIRHRRRGTFVELTRIFFFGFLKPITRSLYAQMAREEITIDGAKDLAVWAIGWDLRFFFVFTTEKRGVCYGKRKRGGIYCTSFCSDGRMNMKGLNILHAFAIYYIVCVRFCTHIFGNSWRRVISMTCRGDPGEMGYPGLLENYAKIFKRVLNRKRLEKIWTIVKCLFGMITDCILNRNLDRVHHVKDMNNFWLILIKAGSTMLA